MNKLKRTVRNQVLRPIAMTVFRVFPDLAASFRLRKEMASNCREADRFFDKRPTLPEGASREDCEQAMQKHSVDISEYLYQYEFYKLTEQQRDEFLSRSAMRALAYKLRMKFPNDSLGLPRFKEQYLGRYTELGFIHRRWLYVPESSYEQFAELLSSVDCIMKPADGSLGIGVQKITRLDDPQLLKALYEKCVRGKMLLEECVRGCDELQAFHPESLNTIRFVTMAFRGRAMAFGAFFRVGVGDMIVDNAHAGGLFAHIDINTGVIDSEAISTNGLRVEKHPDTGLQIKGARIPHWDEVVEYCVNAARQTKNIITGWDVVVNDKGQVEMIEANNRPDFDLMQSPLQVGLKRQVLDSLSELIGQEIKL